MLLCARRPPFEPSAQSTVIFVSKVRQEQLMVLSLRCEWAGAAVGFAKCVGWLWERSALETLSCVVMFVMVPLHCSMIVFLLRSGESLVFLAQIVFVFVEGFVQR